MKLFLASFRPTGKDYLALTAISAELTKWIVAGVGAAGTICAGILSIWALYDKVQNYRANKAAEKAAKQPKFDTGRKQTGGENAYEE